MSGLEKLVGRELRNVYINSDKTRLALELYYEDYVYFSAVGDCCASCWIEHINLPKVGYRGYGKITSVKEHEAQNLKTDDEEMDVLDMTIYEIGTEAGVIQIETRVSHNGYYGGYLSEANPLPSELNMKKVGDDF